MSTGDQIEKILMANRNRASFSRARWHQVCGSVGALDIDFGSGTQEIRICFDSFVFLLQRFKISINIIADQCKFQSCLQSCYHVIQYHYTSVKPISPSTLACDSSLPPHSSVDNIVYLRIQINWFQITKDWGSDNQSLQMRNSLQGVLGKLTSLQECHNNYTHRKKY